MRPPFHTRCIVLLSLCTTLLVSCADFRARENLRDGLLVLDLTQRDFLDIWDVPTYTTAISGDEIIKSGIAGWGGFFFKGREMYEKWDYTERQTQLVFYQQKLVAWKTALSVQKLALGASPGAEPGKPAAVAVEPKAQAQPAPEGAPTLSPAAEPLTGPMPSLRLFKAIAVNPPEG